ncbi:MAG: choice-of-anchor Q domain-containing protein [Panacagrimonas sp.]
MKPDLTKSPRSRPARLAVDARRNLFVLAAAGLFALPTQPAWAANIRVAPGGCTLVDAITAAETDRATGGCRAGRGADTVILPRNSAQTLTAVDHRDFYGAGNGLPQITSQITSQITIQGNGSTIRRSPDAEPFRIFEVDEGSLTLLDTTVSGGIVEGHNGGGIYSYDGVVTLRRCTVSGNTAIRASRDGRGPYGGIGGGIFSGNYYGTAKLNVIDSTISRNYASLWGGGVFSYGTLSMLNSTVSDNVAREVGGGVGEGGFRSEATSTIANSTISGNYAARGGGVHHFRRDLILSNSTVTGNSAGDGRGAGLSSDEVPSGHGITLSASIVSANYGTDVDAREAPFGFTSKGHNLIGTGNATGAFTARGDRRGVIDPGLNALAANGGLTFTHALRADSPAVDAISPDKCPLPNTDQRGFTRPANGDGSGIARCDIGAFELGGSPGDQDGDHDGVSNAQDNCPATANADQADADEDRLGDACDASPLGRCENRNVTLRGTRGDDRLIGTPGADVIAGLSGDDHVEGGGGNDLICGGNGNDRLLGGDGADQLVAGPGTDTLSGGRGDDLLQGGSGEDVLDGGSGRDRCDGGAQDDTATACEQRDDVP